MHIRSYILLHIPGPEEDALRKRYAEEFANSETMAAWAEMQPPRKRTKKSAIDSGNRVLTKQAKRIDEAYFDVDIYTVSLWYHDKINHTLYDLAHQFTNMIKHTFNWMKNTTTKNAQKFSPVVRRFETKNMSRFPELKPIILNNGKQRYPKAPWVAQNTTAVDQLASLCQVPTGWADLRMMFKDLGFAKSSETLLFAGDVGGYTLRHVEMDDDYRSMFIALYRMIEKYTHILLLMSTYTCANTHTLVAYALYVYVDIVCETTIV